MKPTVTFETQCYENDYEYVLDPAYLAKAIAHCNYDFTARVVIINKVMNRRRVTALAEACKAQGVIDAYYFATDYEARALKHFGLTRQSFMGGLDYSRGQLVGLLLAKTDYLLHFTADSWIEDENDVRWIEESIKLMARNPRYLTATPLWYHSYDGAKAEGIEELPDWFAGYGFSDNCYLVPTKVFKERIYGEYNPASDRFPTYAGECFEKRVDSYMRNHGFLRLINKHVSYVHRDFPKKRHLRITGFWQYQWKRVGNALRLAQGLVAPKHPLPTLARVEVIPGMAEHRKQIKLYDVFTFFNELELLEMRLNILAPYVDYFVIIECTETFSGKPKPLVYAENKARFKKFEKQIIHYVTDSVPADEAAFRKRLKDPKTSPLEKEIIDMALHSDNVPPGELHWLKEFYQKESIRLALTKLKDDDVCFIGDVDEIWNPDVVIDYRSDDIFKLRQTVHPYFLNNRSDEPWAGTLVAKYKHIKQSCLNHLRTVTKTKYTYIPNGGWHFTNQGGADRIRKKLESYGHQEFNNDQIKSALERRITSNEDFIGRRFRFWVDESGLPAYIKNNRKKYSDFFK